MLDLKGKRIIWDEDKNQKNMRDHKIALPEAARAFLDPFFVLMYDEAHSSVNEIRWKGLGMLGHSLFLLCFVESGDELRLYSARKAVQRRNGTIVTTSISFSELEKLPPIPPERLAEIEAFENTDFSDCPELTEEEWRTARPLYTKPPKVDIHVRIDADILGWLKGSGKGYQARLNAALRYAMRNGF